MNHPLTALAAGSVGFLIVEMRWPEARWQVATGLVAVVLAPVPILSGGALWWTLAAARRWYGARAESRLAEADVGLMARSVLISVTAGMPLAVALEAAASQVHPYLGAELRGLLRQARRTGLAVVLAESEGRGERMYRLLARAQTTGASVAGAIASFVDERRQQERTKTLEAARRLPVKLTIPLALLILPGFVVLTVGPSVLTTARRLLGPIVPLP